jgi:hypothetical protein
MSCGSAVGGGAEQGVQFFFGDPGGEQVAGRVGVQPQPGVRRARHGRTVRVRRAMPSGATVMCSKLGGTLAFAFREERY